MVFEQYPCILAETYVLRSQRVILVGANVAAGPVDTLVLVAALRLADSMATFQSWNYCQPCFETYKS